MRGAPFDIPDLSGGLDLRSELELVPTNSSPDLMNAVPVLGRRGAVRSRDGSTLFASNLTASDGVARVHSVFAPYLKGVAGGVLNQTLLISYITANATSMQLATVAPGGSATSLGTVAGGIGPYQFVRSVSIDGFGPFYGVSAATNGTGDARSWTGVAGGGLAAWTGRTGTFLPGRSLAWFQNRMFTAGTSGVDLTRRASLRWSDLGDPRAWPGNEVKIGPDEDDEIVALGAVGSYLLVFKRGFIHVVYDSDTGANRRLSGSLGACGAHSVAETPLGLAFVCPNGHVYLTDGNTINQISKGVGPIPLPGTAISPVVPGVIWWNNKIIVTVPDFNTNTTTVWEYDTETSAWFRHQVPAMLNGGLASMYDTSNVERLYAGYRTTGPFAIRVANLFDPATSTDNGVAFNAYWQSGALTHRLWRQVKVSAVRKRLREVHVRGRGPVDVSILKDFSTDTTAFKRTLALGTGAEGEGRVLTPGRARTWAVRFAGTTPWEIDGYTVFADLKDN